MKRSKPNTRKRRNTALELLNFKNSEKFDAVREDFTVFKTLEMKLDDAISSLPNEQGHEILKGAAEEHLAALNGPKPEVTHEIPWFMNHGAKYNNFYVFDKVHADRIAYWQAVFVVSLCACLLIGALIISWRLHLPEWCYK